MKRVKISESQLKRLVELNITNNAPNIGRTRVKETTTTVSAFPPAKPKLKERGRVSKPVNRKRLKPRPTKGTTKVAVPIRYRIDAGGCLKCTGAMANDSEFCPYIEPTCGGVDMSNSNNPVYEETTSAGCLDNSDCTGTDKCVDGECIGAGEPSRVNNTKGLNKSGARRQREKRERTNRIAESIKKGDVKHFLKTIKENTVLLLEKQSCNDYNDCRMKCYNHCGNCQGCCQTKTDGSSWWNECTTPEEGGIGQAWEKDPKGNGMDGVNTNPLLKKRMKKMNRNTVRRQDRDRARRRPYSAKARDMRGSRM